MIHFRISFYDGTATVVIAANCFSEGHFVRFVDHSGVTITMCQWGVVSNITRVDTNIEIPSG